MAMSAVTSTNTIPSRLMSLMMVVLIPQASSDGCTIFRQIGVYIRCRALCVRLLVCSPASNVLPIFTLLHLADTLSSRFQTAEVFGDSGELFQGRLQIFDDAGDKRCW